jgi:hypothetical protein
MPTGTIRYIIYNEFNNENLNLEVNRRKADDSNFQRFRFLHFSKKTLVPSFLVIILNISGNLSK